MSILLVACTHATSPLALVLLGLIVATCQVAKAADDERPNSALAPGGPRIAAYAGTPAEIGADAGQDQPRRIRSLMRIMAIRSLPTRLFHPARVASLIAHISADHLAELDSMAETAGVRRAGILAANVLLDSQCTALVSPAAGEQPLRVARNMDFFPASILGRNTVLTILRPTEKHPIASVGWPGFAGVVSGMNDAGLTACVLVNHASRPMPDGQPICFRIRELLENCATVDEAVMRFSSSLVASSHYVLLADATTAAVVWQDHDGMVHRDAPRDGWLACSNGRRSSEGQPLDWRGRRLEELAAGFDRAAVTEAELRQALTATYLTCINAQAMVFVPATRTLELALGGTWHPAACAPWVRIELLPLLSGSSPHEATTTALEPVHSLPHPLLLR